MLGEVFYTLYDTILAVLGFSTTAPPDVVIFWISGFSLIATFFVVIIPFIIVYKIMRWLGA